jgi:hypothetical protein
LILDGHESHHSVEFEGYCKENKIITLCMPAHASHLLQPLDVGCFGPLKTAYRREIERLIRCFITHITKTEFFPAFHTAHQAAITESNILHPMCLVYKAIGSVEIAVLSFTVSTLVYRGLSAWNSGQPEFSDHALTSSDFRGQLRGRPISSKSVETSKQAKSITVILRFDHYVRGT